MTATTNTHPSGLPEQEPTSPTPGPWLRGDELEAVMPSLKAGDVVEVEHDGHKATGELWPGGHGFLSLWAHTIRTTTGKPGPYLDALRIIERAPEPEPEPEPGADIPDEVVDEALDSFMSALESHERPKGLKVRNFMRAALAAADAKRVELTGDEHHTVDELYDYRMAYNALAVNAMPHLCAKSWKHSDGEPCFGGGWFVVYMDLPTGQVSNHYKAEHWGLFRCPEADSAPEWDGHDPRVALRRLLACPPMAAKSIHHKPKPGPWLRGDELEAVMSTLKAGDVVEMGYKGHTATGKLWADRGLLLLWRLTVRTATGESGGYVYALRIIERAPEPEPEPEPDEVVEAALAAIPWASDHQLADVRAALAAADAKRAELAVGLS